MNRIKLLMVTMTSLLLMVACESGEPSLDPSDDHYDRFEGTAFDNTCITDADCIVGGCGDEVCAAEAVATTCEAFYVPELGSCGCHQGECLWLD